VLAVVRHSERLDHIDPNGYRLTDGGKAFPFDSPLTEDGKELASDVAKELAQLHREAKFSAVICSPYLRCLQTAAPVAQLLGLPVLIDQEVGEVWSEDMPKRAPPHRPVEQLSELTTSLGLNIKNPISDGVVELFGERPVWAESTRDGHKRCLVRMESYIRESTAMRKNFIIICHAPGVAAAVNIFYRGSVDITKLDYCARGVAMRKFSTADSWDTSVFANNWTFDAKGMDMELDVVATESNHMRLCGEIVNRCRELRASREDRENTFRLILMNLPSPS